MEKLFSLMIAEVHKNKEIADLLCISAKTVDTHRSHLMEKLDLHSLIHRQPSWVCGRCVDIELPFVLFSCGIPPEHQFRPPR